MKRSVALSARVAVWDRSSDQPPAKLRSGCAVCRKVRHEQYSGTKELMEELKGHVPRKIGALARPDDLIFASDLPKTRSGKIMRRLLRDIAEGKALGDTTTLADSTVVARLKTEYEDKET